jgi:hypothetical protein
MTHFGIKTQGGFDMRLCDGGTFCVIQIASVNSRRLDFAMTGLESKFGRGLRICKTTGDRMGPRFRGGAFFSVGKGGPALP